MGLRGLVPVLTWGAATLASIGLATVALQPVLRAAAPDPVAAAPPAAAALPSAAPAAPSTPPPAAPPAGSDSSARAAPTRTPAPPTSDPPAPTSPTATQAPPATVVDGWTVTTDADGEPTYTRTFRVAGGVAVIRMVPDQVDLVSATPDPGYTVDVRQHEPGNLAVQFTGPDRYTIVHTIWQDGPVALVSDSDG